MKRLLFLSLLFLLSFTYQLIAQSWYYDFGTDTGTFNTANTADETFLPAAPAGNDMVYVGSSGGGFELVIPSGTDAELKITASNATTASNINKFSVYDYTASPLISIGFNVRFSGGVSTNYGTFYLFVGDGAYYSDNLRYTPSAIFTGLRFTYTATGVDLYIIQDDLHWGTAITTLSRDTDYYIELFGNNSSSSQAYTNNGSYTLVAYSTDLFINNTFQLERSKGTGLLANDLNMDSFLFLGELSTSNNATMTLDEITYINDVIDGPLPVELSSFTAKNIGNNVNLNWRTETEVNNYGFDIERKGKDYQEWTKIGFVEGNGNSNSPKSYSFMDENPTVGQHIQYRLKQIDNDGQFAYSDVVEVLLIADEFILLQNFPNPFNPKTKISYQVQTKSYVKLSVYDVLGNEVVQLINEEKEAGSYEVEFNASTLTSGTYFYQMRVGDLPAGKGGFVQTKKMVVLK